MWKQIKWESNGLKRATVIVMFFNLNTTLPITLLKLSKYAKDGRLVVFCPWEYFKWTNMEFVYRKYKVKQVYTLEELAKEAIERVRCSKKRGKGVMERVGCGKGRGDSNDGHISRSNYLEILVSKQC